MLALLIELSSGHTPEEVDALDIDGLFGGLLAGNLSPNRHFGIYAIVEMMKAQARELRSSRRCTSRTRIRGPGLSPVVPLGSGSVIAQTSPWRRPPGRQPRIGAAPWKNQASVVPRCSRYCRSAK